MVHPLPPRRCALRLVAITRFSALVLLILCLTGAATAAEAAKRRFNVPAAEAAVSLKQFSEQSGVVVIFPEREIRGATTRPVQGEFTIAEALDRMLAGSGLRAVRDQLSGSFAIARVRGPEQAPKAPERPKVAARAEGDATARADTVALGVFEVVATKDRSYSALNTNSITRFRVELEKLPVTADIFTESFIQDVGATSVQDLFVKYGTSGGFGGSNPAEGAEASRPGDSIATSNLKLRGLDSGGARRNGFLPTGAFDLYSIDRVEVIRGPQALLYGGGGAGGVINSISRQARFNQSGGRVEFRYDQEGGKRLGFHAGFGNSRAAVVVAAMADEREYDRLFLGGETYGGYAQLAFRIGSRHTLRLEGEQVTVHNVNALTSASLNSGTGGGFAADPRNGQLLRLLLATGQASDLLGGQLSWKNVDSLGGSWSQRRDITDRAEVTFETRWTPAISTQIAATYDDYRTNLFGAGGGLTPPRRSGNPLDEWAVSFTPVDTPGTFLNRGVRASIAAEFALFGGRARNQVLLGGESTVNNTDQRPYGYFLADASGRPVVNAAQVANNNVGRTPLPPQWYAVGGGPVFAHTFPPLSSTATINGQTYVRDYRTVAGAVPRTAANPRGLAGPNGYVEHETKNTGFYLADFITWFDGRLTTLGGYRVDEVDSVRYDRAIPPPVKTLKETARSLNLGVNYRLTDSLRLFYGYSDSFNPPRVFQLGPTGEFAKVARGIGHEAGIKFSTRSNTFSGSLAYYTVDSKDEQHLISTDEYDAINPPGLNGRVAPSARWVNVDRKSSGAELILTAEPLSGWRSRLSLSRVDGTVGESASFPQLYNDQFHTDARGGVTFSDGSPLMVPATAGDTRPNAPQTQLTVAMMNDRNGGYFANLHPISGHILNAAALGLTRAGVGGATVTTGVAGLPISAHQLNFTDPNGLQGRVTVTRAGEVTSGYAQYAAIFTNHYSFAEGELRGFGIGGNIGYRMEDRSYNYTLVQRDAAGAITGRERRTFSAPAAAVFDLFASYEMRLRGSLRWRVQLKIDNAFNRYKVLVLPDAVTGQPRSAKFTTEPRFVYLTNSIAF